MNNARWNILIYSHFTSNKSQSNFWWHCCLLCDNRLASDSLLSKVTFDILIIEILLILICRRSIYFNSNQSMRWTLIYSISTFRKIVWIFENWIKMFILRQFVSNLEFLHIFLDNMSLALILFLFCRPHLTNGIQWSKLGFYYGIFYGI